MNIYPIKVHIKNNETGEIRIKLDDYKWKNKENIYFQYYEHNYSCDCNRCLFFERALNPDFLFFEDKDPRGFCGHDEKYSIPKIELANGQIIRKEDDLNKDYCRKFKEATGIQI